MPDEAGRELPEEPDDERDEEVVVGEAASEGAAAVDFELEEDMVAEVTLAEAKVVEFLPEVLKFWKSSAGVAEGTVASVESPSSQSCSVLRPGMI